MTAHRITARRQAEDAAFLAALRITGNVRLAARELGVHRGTYFKRRARDPAFAARWDEALAALGSTAPESPPCEAFQEGRAKAGKPPLLLTRYAGRVQLRHLRPGQIGPAEEAAFLAALAASANVRLSAAAAGFAHSSFYARKHRHRAFAREMRAALKHACANLEAELLANGLPEAMASTDWRRNDLPPIPRMTVDQAIQLLHLHQKSVELDWDKPHRRKRRGETWDVYAQRLTVMWMAEKRMEREEAAVREALRAKPPLSRAAGARRPRAAKGDGERRPAGRGACSAANPSDVTAWLGHAAPPPPMFLPSLDQVTGWSKAKGKPPHNPDVAMFGGWRLKDRKKRKRG